MQNSGTELERWREAERSSSLQHTLTPSQVVPACSLSESRSDWRRQLHEAFSSAAKADLPPLSAASQTPSSNTTQVYPPQETVNPQPSVSSFRVTDFRFYDPSSSSSHGNQTMDDNLPSQSITFSDSNTSIGRGQPSDMKMSHDLVPPSTSNMPPQSTYSATPVSPSTFSDSRSSVYPPPAHPHAQFPQQLPQLPHSHSAPAVNPTSLQQRQSVSTLNVKPESRVSTRHNRSRSSAYLHHKTNPPPPMSRRRGTIDLPTRNPQFQSTGHPDVSLPTRTSAALDHTQQSRRSPSRADLEAHMAVDSDPAQELAGQDIYRTPSRAELDDCLATGFGPGYTAEGTGQAQSRTLQDVSGAATHAHLSTTASKGLAKVAEFERCPSRAELEAILATGFGPEDIEKQNQVDPQSTRYLIPVTNLHSMGNWHQPTSITAPTHSQIPVTNHQFAQFGHPSTSHPATQFPVTIQPPVSMGYPSIPNVLTHPQNFAQNHEQAQSGHLFTSTSAPTIHVSNPQPIGLGFHSTMTPTSIHARTDGQPIEMVFSPSTTPVPTHTQIAVARQRPVEEPNYPSATDFVPPQIPPLVAPQPRRVGVDRTIIDPRSLQEYEQVPMQVISPPEEYRWSSNNSFPNWTGTDTEGATGMAVDGDRTVMPVYEFSEASSGVGRQSFEVGGSWNPVMQAQDWPISQ